MPKPSAPIVNGIVEFFWVVLGANAGFEIGFDWVRFASSAKSLIFVSLYCVNVYVYLSVSEIGFVLHKKGGFVESSLQL